MFSTQPVSEHSYCWDISKIILLISFIVFLCSLWHPRPPTHSSILHQLKYVPQLTTWNDNRTKVAFLILATGNYANYTVAQIASARKYLLNCNYVVKYYIFTDRLNEIAKGPDVHAVPKRFTGWPTDSMLRFQFYLEHFDLYDGMDYLFQIDADMNFVDTVGPEILGDLVGTFHPNFLTNLRRTNFPYETRPESCAHIKDNEGEFYAYGAFYGGKREPVVKMWQTLAKCSSRDRYRNIVPKFHDESYLNKYFVHHPPTSWLTPPYCTPEGRGNLFCFSIRLFFQIIFVNSKQTFP